MNASPTECQGCGYKGRTPQALGNHFRSRTCASHERLRAELEGFRTAHRTVKRILLDLELQPQERVEQALDALKGRY